MQLLVSQIFKFIMDPAIKSVKLVQVPAKLNVFHVKVFTCNWLMALVRHVPVDIMTVETYADFVQNIVKLVHLATRLNK